MSDYRSAAPAADQHERGVFDYPAPRGMVVIMSVDSRGDVVEERRVRADVYDVGRLLAEMTATLNAADPVAPRLTVMRGGRA